MRSRPAESLARTSSVTGSPTVRAVTASGAGHRPVRHLDGRVDACPAPSSTVYVTGSGLPVNPCSGVKVTFPVVRRPTTCPVRRPTVVSTGDRSRSSSRTVVGSAFAESLRVTSTVTALPTVLSHASSAVATVA